MNPTLFETADGSHSLLSTRFDVPYHSKHGAIQETEVVFIEAGLRFMAEQKPGSPLHILEMGLGTGLNAFMTLLENRELQCELYYTGVEAFPLNENMVQQLNYPEQLDAPELRPAFEALHQTGPDFVELAPGFHFRRKLQKIEDLEIEGEFDIVYYDAFAPSAQPHLWQERVLTTVKRSMHPGSVLVTYCAQGAFKRLLKSMDFEVEALDGPIGKREMTRAIWMA